jgi:hypothetical protein
MHRYVRVGIVVFLCLLPLAGCGGSKLATVSGTVTYQGNPLTQGAITFFPENGREAYGKIKDGKIVEVTTHTFGSGAMPGQYRVAIFSEANPDDMKASHESLISKKYNDPKTSELTADIKPGDNKLTFELK